MLVEVLADPSRWPTVLSPSMTPVYDEAFLGQAEDVNPKAYIGCSLDFLTAGRRPDPTPEPPPLISIQNKLPPDVPWS